MWHGYCGSNVSLSSPFVWQCHCGSTLAPSCSPAHRTGHADLQHQALGQNVPPPPTTCRVQIGWEVRAEVLVEMREWVGLAPASPDLVLGTQPPTQLRRSRNRPGVARTNSIPATRSSSARCSARTALRYRYASLDSRPPREIARRNTSTSSSSVTVGRGSGKRLAHSMSKEHIKNREWRQSGRPARTVGVDPTARSELAAEWPGLAETGTSAVECVT
jgi:hypothetical protein